MQFQSDIADCEVQIPQLQELSGMGAAYMAGISAGLYDPETVYDCITYTKYSPDMEETVRTQRLSGWQDAVRQVLTH